MNRTQRKQAERDKKLFDDVINGKVKIGMPENRKKRSQANRKGGGVGDIETETEMIEDYLRILKFLLPGALAKLSTLKDPRCEKMCDHSLPTLKIGRAHV